MSAKRKIGMLIIAVVSCALVLKGAHWFVVARNTPSANSCINNLRQIDGAIQQWALEHELPATNKVTLADIRPYLGRGRAGEIPVCPHGGTYSVSRVMDKPRCSMEAHNHVFLP